MREYLLGYLDKLAIKNGKRIEKTPKYVMYARKSSPGKDKQTKSVQDQIKECKQFALSNNLHILHIFKDEMTAHKSGSRTQFAEMMDGIKTGKYNSILTWHPDRLARNMKEAGEIIDLLDNNVIQDIKFPSYTFTNDGNGKLSLGIQFVLAKNYSDNLSVNTRRGNRSRFEEGKGLKDDKLGYVLNAQKHYRPDYRNYNLLEDAFKMALVHKPFTIICEYLNNNKFSHKGKLVKLTPQKLSRLFENPFYAGSWVVGGEIYHLNELDKSFTPIISEEHFLQLRNNLNGTQNYNRSKAPPLLPLRGMVMCSYCSRKMYVGAVTNKKGKRYLRLRCANPNCERTISNKIPTSIRSKVIIDWALDFIQTKINVDKATYEKWIQSIRRNKLENIVALEKEIDRMRNQKLEFNEEIKQHSLSLSRTKNDTAEKVLQEKIDELANNSNELQAKTEEKEKEILNYKNLVDENLWTYTDFVNFIKNCRTIIKERQSIPLVDNTLRMVFANFTVDDKKVVSYQLKPVFETLEKLSLISYGVDDGT